MTKDKLIHLSTGFTIFFLKPLDRDLLRLFFTGPLNGSAGHLNFRAEDIPKIVAFLQAIEPKDQEAM